MSSNRTPTFRRHFGLIVGVTALWLPLSMLFNSLQSLVLPVFVLRYVAPAHKGTVLGVILFVGLAAGALVQPLAGIYSDKHLDARNASSVWWGRRQPLIVGGVVLTLAFRDSVIDVCGCILTHEHPVPPANQARFVAAAKPSSTYIESIGTSHLKA